MNKRCYFYVRFSTNGKTPGLSSLSEAVEGLRSLGHIRESGMGTAKDPRSMWVELWAKARMQTPAQVRKELAKIDGVEIVEVQLIDRGEGRAQSKQLELFKQIYL